MSWNQRNIVILEQFQKNNKKVLTSGNVYAIIFLKLSKEVYL